MIVEGLTYCAQRYLPGIRCAPAFSCPGQVAPDGTESCSEDDRLAAPHRTGTELVLVRDTQNLSRCLLKSHGRHRTSDGYALAVGWTCGWAVWTVYGRLTTWSVGVHASGTEDADVPHTFEDSFINGIRMMVLGHNRLCISAGLIRALGMAFRQSGALGSLRCKGRVCRQL